MIEHECEDCATNIVDPDEAVICTGDHEDLSTPILHEDCPCPEHGFEAEREPVTEPSDVN